jgi:MFS family permease
LSDKKGRKKIILVGLVIYSIATILCGLSKNNWQLGLFQFFAGIGGASYHPAGIPFLSLSVDGKRRGETMGFHQAGGALGSFIGPLASVYIGAAFNWRYSFIILAAINLIIGIVIWHSVSEQEVTLESNRDIPRRTFSNSHVMRLVVLLFSFSFVSLIVYRALTSFLTAYIVAKYSTGLEFAAQILSLFQVMGIIGAPVFGRLSNKTGRRTMLAILVVCQCIFMFLFTYVPLLVSVLVVCVIGCAAYGVAAVQDTWATETNLRSVVGILFGAVVTGNFLSGAFITPIIGFLADQVGFDYSFRILSLVPLLGLPIIRITKLEKSNDG